MSHGPPIHQSPLLLLNKIISIYVILSNETATNIYPLRPLVHFYALISQFQGQKSLKNNDPYKIGSMINRGYLKGRILWSTYKYMVTTIFLSTLKKLALWLIIIEFSLTEMKPILFINKNKGANSISSPITKRKLPNPYLHCRGQHHTHYPPCPPCPSQAKYKHTHG